MRSPASSLPVTHCQRPGYRRSGRTPDQEDLERPVGADPMEPAGNEIGPESHQGAARRVVAEPARDRVELLEMHQVVDCREQEPLAAAEAADLRMLEWTGILFVAGDRSAARSTIRWLEPRRRTRAARCDGHRPGHPRYDPGRIGREPAVRREGGGHREAGASVGVVADRLGDVPVALATGSLERRLRQRHDDGSRASVMAASWATTPAAVPGPARLRTSRRTEMKRPASIPRNAATASGAPASMASSQSVMAAMIGAPDPSATTAARTAPRAARTPSRRRLRPRADRA